MIRVRALLCLLLLPLACSRQNPDRELRVRQVSPEDGSLSVNQAIRVLFDKVLDRASVTPDTVRVLDEAGNAVPGRLRAGDWWLVFEPIPPRKPDLSDGSFVPGRKYRLELAGFPRVNALRGRTGDLLLKPFLREFRIRTSADLPVGVATVFLPEDRRAARFHPLLPVRALEGGQVLELAFSRPLYPPSVRTDAFQLVRQLGVMRIALRKVEILGRDGPSGLGTVLRLYPASPLAPGLYSLYFSAGSQGVVDYGGQELLVPSTLPGRVLIPGGEIPFVVGEEGLSSPFQEDLRRRAPAFAMDPASVWRTEDLAGGLELSPDGLRFPDLDFEEFASLGAFSAEGKLVILGPERSLPGKKEKLGSRWDLDSFVVPRGCRLIVELNQDLDIRITGKFSVEGELLFRLGGKARAQSRKRPGLFPGDPRPTWAEIHPRIRIQVGGLCRIEGSMGMYREEGAQPGLVPGYLWGRGPFFGNWAQSGLQSWIKQPLSDGEQRAPVPKVLPGRWGWLGQWRNLAPARSLRGEVTLLGATQDLDLELRVQGKYEDGRLSSWVRPDVLPRLGRLSALRASIFVDGSTADAGILLQGIGIR